MAEGYSNFSLREIWSQGQSQRRRWYTNKRHTLALAWLWLTEKCIVQLFSMQRFIDNLIWTFWTTVATSVFAVLCPLTRMRFEGGRPFQLFSKSFSDWLLWLYSFRHNSSPCKTRGEHTPILSTRGEYYYLSGKIWGEHTLILITTRRASAVLSSKSDNRTDQKFIICVILWSQKILLEELT